jgi:hypothetical protein
MAGPGGVVMPGHPTTACTPLAKRNRSRACLTGGAAGRSRTRDPDAQSLTGVPDPVNSR